jgi:hypothetical protein
MNIRDDIIPPIMVIIRRRRFRCPVISAYAPIIGDRIAAVSRDTDIVKAKIFDTVLRANTVAFLPVVETYKKAGVAIAIKYGGKKLVAVVVI